VIWKDVAYFYHKSKFWFDVSGGTDVNIRVTMKRDGWDGRMTKSTPFDVQAVQVVIPGLDFRGIAIKVSIKEEVKEDS
jgi:hypothetical protein